MTRDHFNKTSRIFLWRVQTLVVIKLYFIILCQGKELQIKKDFNKKQLLSWLNFDERLLDILSFLTIT